MNHDHHLRHLTLQSTVHDGNVPATVHGRMAADVAQVANAVFDQHMACSVHGRAARIAMARVVPEAVAVQICDTHMAGGRMIVTDAERTGSAAVVAGAIVMRSCVHATHGDVADIGDDHVMRRPSRDAKIGSYGQSVGAFDVCALKMKPDCSLRRVGRIGAIQLEGGEVYRGSRRVQY